MAFLKKHLKSARDALSKQEYREALQHCKAALKEDSQSYDAYLFVGKAAYGLREFDQAEKAYRRAVDINRDIMQAWQGLAELYTETDQVDGLADTYEQLVRLAGTSSQEGAQQRRAQFMRRLADALVRAGRWGDAETRWKELVASAEDAQERLECLCRLANLQLRADELLLEARVQQRLAEDPSGLVSEVVVRAEVEAEWAEEEVVAEHAAEPGEGGDTDSAFHTLREIVGQTAPSPPYAPYHDAYIRRLQRAVRAVPPSSMERHKRHLEVLHHCRTAMDGHCGDRVGGCCSPYPYEAALRVLVIEEEGVTHLPFHGQPLHAQDSSEAVAHGMPITHSYIPPLAVDDIDHIARRLAHSHPSSPYAAVHLCLALRRRHSYLDPSAPPGTPEQQQQQHQEEAENGVPKNVTAILARSCAQSRAAVQKLVQRRSEGLVKVLYRNLKLRGVASAAGWLALTQLLMDCGAAEPALDAARQGLRHVVARVAQGGEYLQQAGYTLQLFAARAMLAAGRLEEAQRAFWALAEGVSEGEVGFGELAGCPAVSIRQQANRGLVHVALAAGDVAAASQLLGEAVAKAAMGRGPSEPWAYSEYAWVLFKQGDNYGARAHMETALDLLKRADPSHVGDIPEADLHCKLGQIYMALGGMYRSDQHYAGAQLMAAARAEGSWQAEAFAHLGVLYQDQGQAGEARARKCFQRALALDPNQELAGACLCDLLEAAGAQDTAIALCKEMAAASQATSRGGGAGSTAADGGWAQRRLAAALLAAGEYEASVGAHQKAIRAVPDEAKLWEGLGAAYHALGRHTAALRAYQKALSLDPKRQYSLLQAASLHYQLGALPDSLACYHHALLEDPAHPAALLGAAEALLASAQFHAQLGAFGAAARELQLAAQHSETAGKSHGNLQAAWKMLGDALVQHSEVIPLQALHNLQHPPSTQHEPLPESLTPPTTTPTTALPPHTPLPKSAPRATWSAGGFVDAAVGGARAQIDAVQRARRAYCKALNLDPSQGGLWGDLASSYHQEARLSALHPSLLPTSQVSELRIQATRLAKGALRAAPASDWLWACLGAVAPDPAVREYALSRALQLNPKRAPTWVLLGRLYAQTGNIPLADKCYEQARSHEPTLVATWEAMGQLAALQQAGGSLPAARADMLDAWEHAVGLGGGLESRLGYATGVLLAGKPVGAAVCATSSVCVQQQPLLAAAHNAVGLAAEARGALDVAAAAFERAADLLSARAEEEQGGRAGGAAWEEYLELPGVGGGAWELWTVAKGNLGRALAKLGRGAEAVAVFQELEGRSALKGNAEGLLGYGWALHKAGETAGSLQVLRQAFLLAAEATRDRHHHGQSATEAAHCAVASAAAQATLLVHLEGGSFVDAVQHLMGCMGTLVQLGQQHLVADMWLSLVAGAAAAGDVDMCELAAAQLSGWVREQKALDQPSVLARLACLQAAQKAALGQVAEARGMVAAALHVNPASREARAALADLALREGPHRAAAAIQAALLIHTQDSQPSPAPPAHCMPTAAAALPLLHPAAALPRSRTELRRLLSSLHASPSSPSLWCAAAVVAYQVAAGSQQCCDFRRASSLCRCALSHQDTAIASAAAADAPTSARVDIAGAEHMRVRLLVLSSSCYLNARWPGGVEAAWAAVESALQVASAACPASAHLAHRQAGRVLAAWGRVEEAKLAYGQALKQGDSVALLELCCTLRQAGRPMEAAALLQEAGVDAMRAQVGSAAGPLVEAAQLELAVSLLEAGELEACRVLAAGVAQAAKDAGGASPAAGALAAVAALRQVGVVDAGAVKPLLTEARRAAAAAVKAAAADASAAGAAGGRASESAAVAMAALAAVELQRGRGEVALQLVQQVEDRQRGLRVGPEAGRRVLLLQQQVAWQLQEPDVAQRLKAKAMHLQPAQPHMRGAVNV